MPASWWKLKGFFNLVVGVSFLSLSLENSGFLNSYQPVISRRNFSRGQHKWQTEAATVLLWLHEPFGTIHAKQQKQAGAENSVNMGCFQRHRGLWQRKLTLFPEWLEARKNNVLSTAVEEPEVACVTFGCFDFLSGFFCTHCLDKMAAKCHSSPPEALLFWIPLILYHFWVE